MLDKNYIEELRALDNKESKSALYDYALQFGIKLKKTRSFDNMISDFESEIIKLKNEPMPEDNDGLSISDLIDADDDLQGKNDYIEGGHDNISEEAKNLLVDSPVENKIEVKLEAPIGEKTLFAFNDEIVEVENKIDEVDFDSNLKTCIEQIKESESVYKLPDNFNPTLLILGKNPGYVTLPWWIYQWIKSTPNWKSIPTSFAHPSAHSTLFSLIYYIKRDGSIRVRETRNSSFDILV